MAGIRRVKPEGPHDAYQVESTLEVISEKFTMNRHHKKYMGTEPLIRLMYSSRSTLPIDENMVRDIGRIARARNGTRGITGALCAMFGNFLQVLEGPRSTVTELFLKIGDDARHSNLQLIEVAPISTRRFAAWSMKASYLDSESTSLGAIFNKYAQYGAKRPETWDPQTCVDFLHETARLVPDRNED